LRVLHFVPRFCWPLNTGANLRNYHLARQLARCSQVTMLTFSNEHGNPKRGKIENSAHSPPEASNRQCPESSGEPTLARPESFYERVITVPRDRGYTFGKIVRGAVGHIPLPVLNYTTDAMKRQLACLLNEQDFDLIQVESVHLISYLPIIRAARNRPSLLLDWHNIESELLSQYSNRATGRLRRAYARRASRQMSALEHCIIKKFDAHVVVSDRDSAQLLGLVPEACVFLIENGVDTAYYSDERIKQAYAAWLAQREPSAPKPISRNCELFGSKRRILFVGSMDYHANVDAVVHFGREVWPSLHERIPELLFTIVGRDPAPEVRQLAVLSGVEVTGTVDDVRPYYHEALAAIVPLNIGGGSRLKILEAMAAGVPVVSTTLGAEGLDVQDDQNILIADTNQGLTNALMLLAESAERRLRLSAAGRALVYERYDWSRLGEALVAIYEALSAKKKGAYRLNNE
jgi:glycosyltransferase involved in cell wall biosynthesis